MRGLSWLIAALLCDRNQLESRDAGFVGDLCVGRGSGNCGNHGSVHGADTDFDPSRCSEGCRLGRRGQVDCRGPPSLSTKTVALAAHDRAAVATKNVAWRVPEDAGRYSQPGEVAAHEGRALGFAKVAPTLKEKFLARLNNPLLHETARTPTTTFFTPTLPAPQSPAPSNIRSKNKLMMFLKCFPSTCLWFGTHIALRPLPVRCSAIRQPEASVVSEFKGSGSGLRELNPNLQPGKLTFCH